MRLLLPSSLRDHIDFAEAFDQLGRALLPDEWDGREVNPPEWDGVLPPDQAAVRNEADRLRSILEVGGAKYDDDRVREVFRQDEYNDVWTDAYLARDKNDPNDWAVIVHRLYCLIEKLSESPASQEPAVIELKEIHRRRQETLTAVLTLLVGGKLVGFCQNGHVPEPIKPEQWADKALRVDVANSKADCCPSGIVVFHRKEFAKTIQQITPISDELTKHGAANAAEVELFRMMSDGKESHPKRDEVLKEFQERWPNLSERDFKQRWKYVCDKTKSGWDKPGRPHEHKTRTI